MSVELGTQTAAVSSTFDINAVANLMTQTSHQIVIHIFGAYTIGYSEDLTPGAIAEKHISPTFEEELSSCDQDVQRVFHKLFEITKVQVSNVSPVLAEVFDVMNEQTANEKTADLLVSTFVLRKTKPLMNKLRSEHPGAIECIRIWQVEQKV